MHEDFLSASKTIPCLKGDFSEWHKGISRYGFWCIAVHDPAWIALFHAAREHVQHFLHPGYQRTPHITIFPCGFMDQNHFSEELLKQQCRVLKKSGTCSFSLSVGSMDSFSTAPYLPVRDASGSLQRIRSLLSSVSSEDNSPDIFTPHITLGFYHDAFETAEVAGCLKCFEYDLPCPMTVRKLLFCTYETKEIQGRFDVIKKVTFL